MQQRLKPPPGGAWAGIVATELLEQLLVAVNDPVAAHHAGLGREAFATLTRDLESTRLRGVLV